MTSPRRTQDSSVLTNGGDSALFNQNMLELALELAVKDPTYEDFALRFAEHFFWIAAAMDPLGEHSVELWDEEDGFFFDVLRYPDGTAERISRARASHRASPGAYVAPNMARSVATPSAFRVRPSSK
jgi:hypothetical protein